MTESRSSLLSSTSQLGLKTGLAIGLATFLAGGGVSAFAQSVPDWVGVAAAVRGEVQLVSQRSAPHRPSSGERLFLGDRVTSGNDSHLQILLRDKTTFTLGADCDLTIDRFVYDPASKSGEIQASVTKGAFRFVTGEIPHRDPDALSIRIPAGTIGVRGTIGEAVVGADAIAIAEGSGLDVSAADPDKAILVILRGPGQNLNTGDRIGQVTVAAAGAKVVLARPNWASFVSSDAVGPSEAFEVPAAMQGLLTEALRPQSGGTKKEEGEGNSGGGDSEGETDTAMAGGGASVSSEAGQETAAGADLSGFQYGAEEAQLAGSVETQVETAYVDPPTRPDEFLTRQGVADYNIPNLEDTLLSDGGSYTYTGLIDFGSRIWYSTAAFFTAGGFSDSVSAAGTVDLSGNVISRSTTDTSYGGGRSATLNELIINLDGEIAGGIQHSVEIIDPGGGGTITGSGVASEDP